MSIPFDQRLAKLRILMRRADVAYEQAEKEYNRMCEEARKPVHAAHEEKVRLFSEYDRIARELGYCGNCGNPLKDCRCVWLAGAAG